MPSALPSPTSKVTKFTNCRLLKGESLVTQDLWVSSSTGKVIQSQEAFYSQLCVPDETIDLGGRIISPGFIDAQLNGAFGFDFSSIPEDDDPNTYGKEFRRINGLLVKTGVTSYLPTITSSRPEVYHHALPFLGPSGTDRCASNGTESLGAHVEGPFLAPTKNGIHPIPVLLAPKSNDLTSLSDCYGASNLLGNVRLITAAPELPHMTSLIPTLTSPPHNIIFSIGHTESTYEDATQAISAGATMITHLFNAMRPLHHRNPGIFGLLGTTPTTSTSPTTTPPSTPITTQPAISTPIQTSNSIPQRPYFGIIADSIHLHPTTITLAYNAHPSGLILVTDAMHLVGLPDGRYAWNGDFIIKTGIHLRLESDNKIAGSSITLVECVSNFLNWTGCSVAQALKAVTETPARMLGVHGTKGGLEGGMDADLCVLDVVEEVDGRRRVRVDEVWKFGVRAFEREGEVEGEGEELEKEREREKGLPLRNRVEMEM
ncbi:carbohydrate esterase family 9 protein [Sclerotinia borealis F-4128]|uniref:N-acetylglucosamine-6-phosphate deacetylase n=1 Tax=Sclerotinia borealis (strain F-4128) TaxID=1432307 RepID=W9CHD3_SCLBF|nr:carbohydrate esterase family 9 protein [Sclerotinia borealis F-4128]